MGESGIIMLTYLGGMDYPHLCKKCRKAVDDAREALVIMFPDGEDIDYDPEAPCNFVYDRGGFCGGKECVNKPGDILCWNGLDVNCNSFVCPKHGNENRAKYQLPLMKD